MGKRKRFRNLGKLLGKLGGKVLRGIPNSGRRRDFRDGGDGEADRPAGPLRARDSQDGGRPRRWGGTRGCWPECGRDSRHARRG
jgi:hypothetical protein